MCVSLSVCVRGNHLYYTNPPHTPGPSAHAKDLSTQIEEKENVKHEAEMLAAAREVQLQELDQLLQEQTRRCLAWEKAYASLREQVCVCVCVHVGSEAQSEAKLANMYTYILTLPLHTHPHAHTHTHAHTRTSTSAPCEAAADLPEG